MMIAENLKERKINIWKNSLKRYQEIFETKNKEFAQELSIIKNTKVILDEKITIVLIGQTKAGKSNILNALIGKNLLQCDDQNCTFFGIKIQPSFEKPVFFSNSSNKIQGDEAIKKEIEDLNKKERENETNFVLEDKAIHQEVFRKIWTLQTPMKVFGRNKTLQEIRDEFEFLEVCDLPGISDAELKWNLKDISKAFKKMINYEQRDNLENVNKLKFNEILRKINMDIIILVVDLNLTNNLKNFFKYFKKSLFEGEDKAKVKKILQNNHMLIIINKMDNIEKKLMKKSTKKRKRLFGKFI